MGQPRFLHHTDECGSDEEVQNKCHGINERGDKGRRHNRRVEAYSLCRDGQKRACELCDYDRGEERQRHGESYGESHLGVLHYQSVHEKHLGKGDRCEHRARHKSAERFL